jgi:hypothetical protein
LQVASIGTINEQHIGVGQLFGGWKLISAVALRAALVQQLCPILKKSWMIVHSRPVGLRTGTDEYAQRCSASRASAADFSVLETSAGEKSARALARYGCGGALANRLHPTANGRIASIEAPRLRAIVEMATEPELATFLQIPAWPGPMNAPSLPSSSVPPFFI